jgi:hypothetical protein
VRYVASVLAAIAVASGASIATPTSDPVGPSQIATAAGNVRISDAVRAQLQDTVERLAPSGRTKLAVSADPRLPPNFVNIYNKDGFSKTTEGPVGPDYDKSAAKRVPTQRPGITTRAPASLKSLPTNTPQEPLR